MRATKFLRLVAHVLEVYKDGSHYEETSEGRSECRSAPLPAARAPWLFLPSAAPVRRRAPRSSAEQQPPHPR